MRGRLWWLRRATAVLAIYFVHAGCVAGNGATATQRPASSGFGVRSGKPTFEPWKPATTPERIPLVEDEFNAVVTNSKRRLKYCADTTASAEESAFDQRFIARWTIKRDGTVVDAELLESTLDSPAFAECILRVISRLSFPTSPGKPELLVTYPFLLIAH